MRTILIMAASCLALAGCVAGSPLKADASTDTASAGAAFPVTDTAPLSPPDMSPKFVIPVTGGLPVIALPLGGNFYLPVTGGLPVIGMPVN